MNDVRRQLVVFERNGQILKWHDRMIPLGTEWREQIDARLEYAQIVLLFMSPHFIDSRYCYEVEGQAALRRHHSGEACVVPIVLRPCAWEATPFGALQSLPTGAKPISRWEDRDEACLAVARAVMTVVDELAVRPSARQELQPENAVFKAPYKAIQKNDLTAAKFVYCQRCGHAAGKKSVCTGIYVQHDFTSGHVNDYCRRCGVRPGTKSTCVGVYTNHEFANSGSGFVICSRCGIGSGERSTCTGVYIDHSFIEML